MACKYYNKCTAEYKDGYCLSEPLYENSACASFDKFENSHHSVETKSDNPYWNNICNIANKQRKKGIETYGQGLEDNTWCIEKRIQYLEEELVDALMYCEWIKDKLKERNSKCQN